MSDERYWMQQWPAEKLYFDQPEIKLGTVFQALPFLCRYRGNVSHFYSVAQHACFMAYEAMTMTNNPGLALMCLHHDDHETIIGDWPSPIKWMYHKIAELEDQFQQCTWDMLGIDPNFVKEWIPIVHQYDRLIKYNEGWRLQDPVDSWPDRFAPGLKTLNGWENVWACWDIDFARQRFIGMHHELYEHALAEGVIVSPMEEYP